MLLQYFFTVTCEYEDEYKDFFGAEKWTRGFYSRTDDKKNMARTAKRYFAKHHIPAVILDISDPEMRLIIR